MKKALLVAGTLILAVTLPSASISVADTVLVLSSHEPEYEAVAAGFRGAFSRDFQEINLEGSDEKQRIRGEQLRAAKPAAAVVVGDLAAQMAKWYLEDVPVVYCDAVRAAKLSLTKAKAAGIYHEPDPQEQLKIIHELFPEKSRVGLLYSPAYTRISEKNLEREVVGLGITLETVAMDSIKEVPKRLREIMPRVDLLWVFTDPVVFSSHSIQYIVLESITAGVPIFCGDRRLAHSGATGALVPDFEDVGKTAARQADRILMRGAPDPGTIRYPKGRLVINEKTGSMLGVSFPAEMLERAAEVIK